MFLLASKLTLFLRKHPALMVALLVAASLVAAKFGHHGRGLWDGPI